MTRVRRESLFTVFPDLFKKIKERKGNGKERNRKEDAGISYYSILYREGWRIEHYSSVHFSPSILSDSL